MSASDSTHALDGIAIIGMSGRFPGAKNVAQFWKNLAGGVESITKFTEAETEYSVASAEEKAQGRRVVRARGILEDTDLFDPAFFGIYPREAELMDPQHRFFLECAWEALESAGYDPEAYAGLIGVYAGLSMNTYLLNNLCRDRAFAANFAGNYQIGEYQVMMGNDKDFMPTRVSYKLNLRGPSMAVQTACSTSLVAVSQACTSLLNYQCDMALAGGVSITFPQKRDYFYEEDGMASVDGTCRTFDANAKGTVFGHGTAVVLLKRLADAVADGDHVLAVIKGTAVNNDGSEKIGYAAPSVKAQADVIAMAQAAAGVSPEDISYVETHGTGTPLGDPIEVAALTQAFRAGGATRNAYCALGTGKTNISHLDVAAGATGLIKLVLQLQHEAIPPLLHFKAPNPKIDFASSPFFPVTKLTPWKRGSTPRRAGVSAFGVGGTNAHAVVEEAPAIEPSGPARPQQLVVLSARTETALAAMSANLAAALEARPALNLADVAFTLHQGRRAFAHRRAVVAADAVDAAPKLRALEPKLVATGHAPKEAASVAFIFPGQGSQHIDMGRELYESEPVFRAEVDLCAGLLQQHLAVDIRSVLYPDPSGRAAAQKQIGETAITQPAMFVVEYALARLWLSWGVKPAVLVGHSIGEYVCAVLAGSLTLEDALALLATRARLMQQLPAGSMLAVRLPAHEAEPLLPAGASIAAINSVKTCTVSGPTPVLEKFLADLTARKIAARLLPTSHAFHSAMMDPILAEFSAAAAKTGRQAPNVPWISTCTGDWMTAADLQDAAYWSRQLRQPVKFTAALDTLFKDAQPVLLEIGPAQTLSQLVRQHPAKAAATPVIATLGPEGETPRDLTAILGALGRLWIAGVCPDWTAFYTEQRRQRVPLPTYPFERQRFWIEPTKAEAISDPATAGTTSDVVPEVEVVAPIAEEAPPAAPAPLEPRRDRIAAQLRHAIKDLSGLAVTDDKTSFVEMGFDSLFLTQASQEFQRQYGIKVTFRQLINELSTVADLAKHFDEKLAPEPPPAAPQPKAAPLKPTAAAHRGANPPSVAGAPASDLVRQLLLQQREFMTQQLPLLNSVLGAAAAHPIPLPASSPALLLSKAATPAPAAAGATPVVGGVQNNAFGPSAGAKGAEIELTVAQRRYLDDLIARYTKKTARSKALTQQHRQWYADPRTASGFNRQWKEMCYQLVVESSKGSRLRDIDGNEYIDMLNGFGPNFLGHSPAFVTEALKRQLDLGIEVGPQSPIAGEAARLFCELTGNERASFVNTGSEAVYAAMRLARTVTGRDKIVVFNRDYHGNFDEVLVRGLGAAADFRTVPSAPGIPRRAVQDMYVLDYGSDEALAFIEKHADEIAAVLIEPVQSRRPEFQPYAFVKAVRALTERTGTLFIFDEVITGFRDGLKGAQAIFDVRADIATYGKVVGGGMPIGVVAGKAQYMDTFDGGMWQYGDDSAPEKPVTFFAGTFVRHPMTMAAVLAVLNYLKDQPVSFWNAINAKAKRLATTVDAFFVERGIPIRMPHFCSQMFVRVQDDQKFGNLLFFHLREKGIFLLESFPCYMTAAHTDADVDRVIAAFKESALALQEMGFFPPPPGEEGVTGSPSGPSPRPAAPAPAPVIAKAPGAASATVSQTSSATRFPLAEGQREMWLGAQMSPEAAGPHHACNLIELTGALDIAALKRAFALVIERHEGLRAVFSEDGTEVIVREKFELDIPLEDLSQLTPADRQAAADQFIRTDGRRLFDLANGPLIAARLLRFGPDHHQLVFTAQMIACDGWSHYVVFEELSAIYSAFVESRAPELPPAIPMREYALWQQQHRNDGEAKACENFWLSKFHAVPVHLDLPTTGPRPPNRTVTADRREIVLSREFYTALKSFAKEQKNSSFAVLLAAFQTWLYRLSGTDDVVVGVPFSAQGPLGFDTLVGQCANTLPLRAKVDPAESFASLLKRTWADLLDAQENWNYTFGRLAQQLAIPRDPSRMPLVSVLFNIDPPMAKVGFARLKHRFITGPRYFFQYDLGFNLIEEENALRLECDYNVNLFEGETIQAWLASYETLLKKLLVAPGTSLGRLPMVPGTQAIPVPSQNAAGVPAGAVEMVTALIDAQCTRQAKAIAVTDEAGSLSYAELDRRAASLANYLTGIGAGPGATVAVVLERTTDLAVAVVAGLRSGAPLLVLDADAPIAANATLLSRAETKIVVTRAALVDAVPAALKTVNLDRDAAKISVAVKSSPAAVQSPDSVALLVPAASTENSPQLVEISHRNLANLVAALEQRPGIKITDAMLAASAFAQAAGLVELILPWCVGARALLATQTIAANPAAVIQFAATTAPTIVHSTPSGWRGLLSAGWRPSAMISAWSSGEALTEHLAARLLAGSASLWNLYGAVEATVWAAAGRVDRPQPLFLGEPLRGTRIEILDSHAEAVPIGVPGELSLAGEGLSRGYRGAVELTAQRFAADALGVRVFRTGDRARFRPGNNLEYLGRRDREFKVRGCHVELAHIEAVVAQHGAVAAAVVQPAATKGTGPGLTAYFTRKTEGHDAVIGLSEHAVIRELRQLVRDQLPEYMRPTHWVPVGQFPVSASGKLDYSSLPAPGDASQVADDYAAPENETQSALVKIWQRTLKLDRVGIRESFFDLGGQSLLAVSLFTEIEKTFGRKLPLSTLFRAPTVEKLSSILTRGEANESDWSSLVPIQPKGKLTPLFLVHGAGGNVLLYRTLASYLSPGRPLYGLQSRGLDGKSEPLKTIEAMAEAYLAEVRAVQPQGPYLLGGYCLGGTVAYEMAQRLNQAGEKVALVAMLDTYNFSRALKASFAGFMFEKLKFHCANFARLRPGDMWSYLVEKVRLARDGELRNLMTSKPDSSEAEGVARATSGPEASVQAINDHAADTYLPKHYAGGITLFKPEANYKFYPDPKMGWGDLVGGELESVEFPFKPHAMLVEPYVQQLAKALNQAMDKKAPAL